MASVTATRKVTSFGVTCPECGSADDTVKIDLNDLTACVCVGCDAEFSPAEAVARIGAQLKRWEAVARWVALAGECLAE